MNRILKMQNTIQPYAWGSRHGLAEFMGESEPSDNPKAELWMGAHPKAPSKVWLAGRWQSLDKVIEEDPRGVLGVETASRHANRLPYLLKVLAADEPLSIQAHPSEQQAREGFKHENDQGIPLSAGHRNYKDSNHKPECICAMTPFWGVCGFRPTTEMLPLVKTIWPKGDAATDALLGLLEDRQNLALFFEKLMTLDEDARHALLDQVIDRATPIADQHAVFDWVLRLHRRYPYDIGVLSPVLLNLFCLQPQEALFLPACQLHAYFEGMGIEIMANSDNVLRGGLTPKHVDVPQLLQILDFEAMPLDLMKPAVIGPVEYRYPSQAEEFVLSRLVVSDTIPYISPESNRRSAEILLCTDGEASVCTRESEKTLTIPKGQSVLVPAGISGYAIGGQATLYKAGVNLSARQA